MYNRRQKEQTDQRNYVIRPALKEKFTKNVFIFFNHYRKFMILFTNLLKTI